MKYRLTEETKKQRGVTLYRIEAIESFGPVKAGDKGGCIEKEQNLSHTGDARVYGDAWVYGDAQVYGNAWVYGDARVYGDAWEVSPLYIQGSRYSVSAPKKGRIRIGCQDHSIATWLRHGEDIAEKCGKADLIPEYREYVLLFARRYAPKLLEGKDDA